MRTAVAPSLGQHQCAKCSVSYGGSVRHEVRTNVLEAAAGDADGSYTNGFVDVNGLIVIAGSGDATTNSVDTGGATNAPSHYYRIRLVP